MIRRLLALFDLALVSRGEADLLAAICACERALVTKIGGAYVVIGERVATDDEFLKAVGLKEGTP